MTMTKPKTSKLRLEYHAAIERDEDGRWCVEFKDEPIFTYGINLEQAKFHALEALSCHTDVELPDLAQRTRLVFDIKLPSAQRKLLENYHAAKKEAHDSRQRQTARRNSAILNFLGAGMTSRDIGALLGVTRQRANVLVRDAQNLTVHHGRKHRRGDAHSPD